MAAETDARVIQSLPHQKLNRLAHFEPQSGRLCRFRSSLSWFSHSSVTSHDQLIERGAITD
jgi:hypothetical protein